MRNELTSNSVSQKVTSMFNKILMKYILLSCKSRLEFICIIITHTEYCIARRINSYAAPFSREIRPRRHCLNMKIEKHTISLLCNNKAISSTKYFCTSNSWILMILILWQENSWKSWIEK